MNRDEVEAVLGHEIAHATNGDMVTLALVQGGVTVIVREQRPGGLGDALLQPPADPCSGHSKNAAYFGEV